jgi:hypothetical protein
MYEHQRIEYHGYTIRIVEDQDPGNPFKEWDAMPTILHWHPRYLLGERIEMPYDKDEYDAAVESIKAEYGATVVLPLYLYDHSGISVSTGPFGCKWDSGQVGFVFMSEHAIQQGWGSHKHPTDEELPSIIESSVKTFDTYLRGEVVGYIVEHPDYDVRDDSCWGFYDQDDCLAEAKSIVDYEVKTRVQEDAKINRCMAL